MIIQEGGGPIDLEEESREETDIKDDDDDKADAADDRTIRNNQLNDSDHFPLRQSHQK
jgi:hypothetical protein